MAQKDVPIGTVILGQEPSIKLFKAPTLPWGQPKMSIAPSLAFDELTTPRFETPAQKTFYEQVIKPQQIETQRYQDLGYTSSQAQKLARESLKQGGVYVR